MASWAYFGDQSQTPDEADRAAQCVPPLLASLPASLPSSLTGRGGCWLGRRPWGTVWVQILALPLASC